MNITMLIGNAGGKPTLNQTTKGVNVANFSLATVERYKDSQGVPKKNTDWHNIAIFGPLAEIAAKYVDAGTVVAVTGKLNNEAYKDKDGNPRVSSTLHVDTFEIMSGGTKKADSAKPQDSKAPATPKIGDTCPKCKTGKIVQKTYKGDTFLACDQYPTCKTTFKIDGKGK